MPKTETQLTPAQEKTRKAQISRIHCVARELGWVGSNKDLLYMQVEIATGSDSISALSPAQLGRVLDRLKAVLGTHRNKQAKIEAQSENIIQLPTPAMRERAAALMEELRLLCGIKNPAGYLATVAERACGKPIERLTRLEYAHVIEALKKIRSRF